MIVSSMTPNQIYDEIMADVPNMMNVLKYKQEKVRQRVLRSQLFPMCLHALITTKRKNNWLLVWNIKSKKDISRDICAAGSCIQDTQAGKFVLIRQLTEGVPSLMIYTPHFFKRYAERVGIDLQGIPLIIEFFKKNNTSYIKKRIIRGKEELTATLNEGVAFCREIDNCHHRCYIMKTFINYDMRKEDQEPGFIESELCRLKGDAEYEEELKANPDLAWYNSLQY